MKRVFTIVCLSIESLPLNSSRVRATILSISLSKYVTIEFGTVSNVNPSECANNDSGFELG